jgi:hypothetical protein
MTITSVPELERLLDEYAAAKVEFDKPMPVSDIEFYKREDRLLRAVGDVQKAATRDTVRALIDAAKAGNRVVRRLYVPDGYGTVEACIYDLRTANAPLFPDKEAE